MQSSRGELRALCRFVGEGVSAGVLLEATEPRAADRWPQTAAKLEMLVEDSGAASTLRPLLREAGGLDVFMAQVFARLAQGAQDDGLLRFEGLGELSSRERSGATADGYHELHAHFRGSIPFEDLWADWMHRARSRAKWRHEILYRGETRARRLERAANVHEAVTGLRPGTKSARPGEVVRGLMLLVRAQMAGPVAIRYLLILVNTRRAFLVRRDAVGLASFTRAYARVARASKRRWLRHDTRARVQDVCRRFEATGCRVLELRPTLKANRRETQAALRELVLGYLEYVKRSTDPIAMGLVCSFFKQDGVTGCRHGERKDIDTVERLCAQQRLWVRQAKDLIAILDAVPAIRAFVVGVDAAGRERGAPCRFFAAAYRVIRDYNRRYNLVAARGRTFDVADLELRTRGLPVEAAWAGLNGEPPWSRLGSRARLGFTIHAGEDFVDPVTGLREVWEAIDYLDLQPGDRIGHALVLALRAEALESWIEDHADGQDPPERSKPAGVHALDMAWAHGRVSTPRASDLELSRAVIDAVRDLPIHDSAGLLLRSPDPPARVPLFGAAFLEPETPASGCAARVTFDETWKRDFERMRRQVEEFVVQRGVVIESCPSSNCVVAGLREPPLKTLLDNELLQVALATDDPGLLGAWPDDELARLDHDADRERVLQTARRASFVRRTDHA